MFMYIYKSMYVHTFPEHIHTHIYIYTYTYIDISVCQLYYNKAVRKKREKVLNINNH